MARHRNQGAATRRLPIALLVAVAALLPVAAHARSLVCAPDGRGCSYTKLKCADVYLPKGWSCKAAVASRVDNGRIVRLADGRVAVVGGGTTTYLLSDALEAKLARPSEEELLRLLSNDRAPVSDRALQEFANESGLPVVMQPRVIPRADKTLPAPAAAATKR